MYMEINPYRYTFDEICVFLLDYKEKGLHAYCNYQGHYLDSTNFDEEQAYLEVMGCTKEEYFMNVQSELTKNFKL